eukprot:CAMPEP_0184675096 /NCGR_PEP_ID=MMETSP0308-20130426/87603_1 /TAXON_ID=38269 /ORGANISM="Gloeochaete witrockiana, Strain SAG 46.84" /LENGTH=199 /DNA_ID=CAMNT_0027122771 /DNA_START=75 /DNA_END=674 /DNA_ORIENTATION=+
MTRFSSACPVEDKAAARFPSLAELKAVLVDSDSSDSEDDDLYNDGTLSASLIHPNICITDTEMCLLLQVLTEEVSTMNCVCEIALRTCSFNNGATLFDVKLINYLNLKWESTERILRQLFCMGPNVKAYFDSRRRSLFHTYGANGPQVVNMLSAWQTYSTLIVQCSSLNSTSDVAFDATDFIQIDQDTTTTPSILPASC